MNITRAIKLALRRINEHHPVLGQHLATTLKTGAYCSYTPNPPPAHHLAELNTFKTRQRVETETGPLLSLSVSHPCFSVLFPPLRLPSLSLSLISVSSLSLSSFSP